MSWTDSGRRPPDGTWLTVSVRAIRPDDRAAWQPLWDGYNAFYGRAGATALDPAITQATWVRFLDPHEPVDAYVAESQGRLVGLVHAVLHRSTTRLEPTCYLQDLYTDPAVRGRGIGRALIAAVDAHAREHGVRRVYWHTHTGNAAGRLLYDRVAQHAGFIVYTQDL